MKEYKPIEPKTVYTAAIAAWVAVFALVAYAGGGILNGIIFANIAIAFVFLGATGVNANRFSKWLREFNGQHR